MMAVTLLIGLVKDPIPGFESRHPNSISENLSSKPLSRFLLTKYIVQQSIECKERFLS